MAQASVSAYDAMLLALLEAHPRTWKELDAAGYGVYCILGIVVRTLERKTHIFTLGPDLVSVEKLK